MADSSITVDDDGSDVECDTRTVESGDHRPVVVIGDPATNAGVAGVDATYGLAVDVKRMVPVRVSTATSSVQSVATSSSQILAANASRSMGWVKNISDEVIYVALGETAATNKPTLLNPGDTLLLGGPGWVFTGAVNAIHAGSGGKNVEVVEI